MDDLAEMRDAGVGSLKVEGRMKAPDYVYSVVSAYRGALEALASGDKDGTGGRHASPAAQRAFNRDFTPTPTSSGRPMTA